MPTSKRSCSNQRIGSSRSSDLCFGDWMRAIPRAILNATSGNGDTLGSTSLSLRRVWRTNHALRKLRDVSPGKRSVKTAHFLRGRHDTGFCFIDPKNQPQRVIPRAARHETFDPSPKMQAGVCEGLRLRLRVKRAISHFSPPGVTLHLSGMLIEPSRACRFRCFWLRRSKASAHRGRSFQTEGRASYLKRCRPLRFEVRP